ncbi:hypothetical protein BWQ96_02590 [Gracilariopsis chorda]|uniref:Receptor expression-enhancing protein n=1 Tax=Gracilariopsis chorda TaxID=448386 RepID=A0A2V3IZP1_9FLOR|nr:hypothetical protein BWQ96_02590 [Gracilariopsis chorda]|eukprot:PXF47611.1 hypothetical protein BWQ96_02590 [Gracilariopsis chorda]
MGNIVTNLACHAIAGLYSSYASYRALKRNVSNAHLVNLLTTWLVTTVFLLLTDNIVDPVFGPWFPFYFPAKLLLIVWMVYPGTRGACYVFVRYIEPTFQRVAIRAFPS